MGGLTGLYQGTNENRKTVLQETLNSIKMSRSEKVTSYLTRIQQACDEFATVGKFVHDSEIVKAALKGCMKKWSTFVAGILAHQLPDWSQLWDDFTQKEI